MAIQSDHEFAPTQIARAVFPTAFRGYDQDAVRRYLSRLAAALEHQQEYAGLGELEARTPAHERVEELEAEIESLQDEIKDLELELVQRSVDGADRSEPEAETTSEADRRETADFDEHRAIELLGKETARVLESARSAASDILKRAETQAASLKTQAKSELAEARKRADSLLATKQTETQEMVDRMLAEADASAQKVTAEADEHRAAVLEESSKILTEAEELSEAEQAEAEQRAKQIVADAETLRQQVIAELVVERRDAQNELDRVATARDRLAMSLAVARSELDEVADALVDSASEPDREPELDIDAEVDGLIESLETEAEPQELDLGLAETPAEGPTSTPTETPGEASSDSSDEVSNDASGGASNGASTGTQEQKPSSKKSSSKKKRQRNRSHTPVADSGDRAGADSDSASDRAQASNSNGAKAQNSNSKTSNSKTLNSSAETLVKADEDEAEIDSDTDAGTDTNTDTDAGTDTSAETDTKAETAADLETVVDDDVQVININPAPAQGEELSLVEGFTTLDVSDLGSDSEEVENADAATELIDLTADDSSDGKSPDGKSPDGDSLGGDSPDGASPGGESALVEADDDEDQGLVFSVLVNEPQSPEEVITTVASRIATVQRDRTRGDLLIEESFTGRLPKPFAARDVTLTRSGPNFRRQLRRALNDDQSDVLDRLRAGRGPIKVEELPPFGDQIDRYLAPLRRGLAEIAQAGARAGGQSDLSQSALDNLVRQLAKYIVDKVRVPTIGVVEESSDSDRERILEPIRALYRDFRNVGLPDLTEDALYESFAIGLYDAIEPAAPVRWITDPRSDPDPVCEINRAKDDVVKGEVFPSGHARPLSLPGCRCLVAVAKY